MNTRLVLSRPLPGPAQTLAVASLVFAGLMLWARNGGPRDLAMTFTVIASASFVVAALAAGALGGSYGRLMAGGLVFCMLGDILGPGNFMLGLYAFLLAHFGIAGAFFSRGMDRRKLAAAVPVAIAVSAGVYVLWLGPAVPPNERLQIIGYTVVITVMLIAVGGSRSFPGRGLALAGGIVFYLSDVFLANWRYVSEGRWNQFVCYPLYYTACVLLALSVLAFSRGSARE